MGTGTADHGGCSAHPSKGQPPAPIRPPVMAPGQPLAPLAHATAAPKRKLGDECPTYVFGSRIFRQ